MLKKALPGVYSPWSYDIHIYHDLFCNLIAAGKNQILKMSNAQISEGSYIRRCQNDNSSVNKIDEMPLKARPCPFIQILSRFYPDFILSLS